MEQGAGGMLGGGGGRGASQRSGAAAKPAKKLTISLKKGEFSPVAHATFLHTPRADLCAICGGGPLTTFLPPPPLSLPCGETEKPQLPENFEEETWQRLKDCVRAVHMQQPVTQSFEQLYKVARPDQPLPPRQTAPRCTLSRQFRPLLTLPQPGVRVCVRRVWRTSASTKRERTCTNVYRGNAKKTSAKTLQVKGRRNHTTPTSPQGCNNNQMACRAEARIREHSTPPPEE